MSTYTLSNKLFNNFFTNWDQAFLNGDHAYWRRNDNSVKHKEEDDHHEYYVALAGFKKEDIKLKLDEQRIFIFVKNDKDSLSYSFLLPEEVDFSSCSAKHEDGLLTIKVNKSERSKPKTIKIM